MPRNSATDRVAYRDRCVPSSVRIVPVYGMYRTCIPNACSFVRRTLVRRTNEHLYGNACSIDSRTPVPERVFDDGGEREGDTGPPPPPPKTEGVPPGLSHPDSSGTNIPLFKLHGTNLFQKV